MTNIIALFLPLLSGLFFLIGLGIVKYSKHKKTLSILSIGLAFVVMFGMIFLDLIPEIILLTDSLQNQKIVKIIYVLCFIGLGMMILKIFDKFLPAHNHEHNEKEKNKEEHNHHMAHIGFILATSLILHNILEGMSMYVVGIENLKAGLLLACGVGLHNLPLGIEIASGLEKEKKKRYIIFISLFLSAFLGACILHLFSFEFTIFQEFALICISCGMILYIALFELLKEIKNYRNNKYIYIGMAIGLFLIAWMTFLG